MKKQTLLILFLSALLCLTMLFVACDQNETETTTTTVATTETTEEITTEAAIEDVEVNYSDIIAEWNNYIEFNAPEETPVLSPNDYQHIISNSPSDNVTVQISGNLLHVMEIEDKEHSDWFGAIVEYYKTRKITHTVYNMTNGEKVFSITVPEYRFETVEAPSTYEFTFLGGLFEVKIGSLQKKEIEVGTGEDPQYYYEYEYTYNYYTDLGATIATSLEESVYEVKYTETGDKFIYVEDKCYLVRDGKIFYTFNKGQERNLPKIDVEYLNFKYVIDNDGYTYRVFDKDYNLLCTYNVPTAYDISQATILNNGNIFVQGFNALDYDVTEYDFEVGSYKYDIYQAVVDVTTGKVTVLDTEYYFASNIVSNAINNSFNIKMKTDGQFAEAYKIVEGKLVADTSFLVLDNDMKVVKALPKFFKNQNTGTRFLDYGKLSVNIAAPEYEAVYYTVDFAEKTVELDVSRQNAYNFHELNNGFLYNGVIYSKDLVEIYDFEENDVVNYQIYGDSFLIYKSNTDEFGITQYKAYVLTINGTSYNEYLIASYYDNDNNYLDVRYDEYLNSDCFIVTTYSNYFGYTRIENVAIYNSIGQNIAGGKNGTTLVSVSETGALIKVVYENYFGENVEHYYFFKY